MPEIDRSGALSQVRISRERAGYAEVIVTSCRRTMLRAVELDGRMSRRPRWVGRTPNVRAASFGARRTFTSSERFVSSREPNVDLISQTATAYVFSCSAKRSIEPRSPNSENVTSTFVCQPRRRNTDAAASTVEAWSRSSSWSAAAPFHQAFMRRRASTAAKARRARSTLTLPMRPDSMSITSSTGMSALPASVSWVTPDRLRMARSSSPNRSSSGFMSASLVGAAYRALLNSC